MIKKEKIKEIGFLLNKFQERNLDYARLPKCSFFLGAGCSKSSGILTSWEIIEKLRKLWYLNNFTNCMEFKISDFEINESSFKEIEDDFQVKYLEQETTLKKRVKNALTDFRKNPPVYLKMYLETAKDNEIIENIFNDLLYGFWFETYSENPRERQKLIEYLIDLKEPSGAYLLFSHLIANSKITNIFTTNFDDLLYDSLIRYTDIKPKVYSHNEVAQFINTYSSRPNIIKLHGDFLFENIKNTKPETSLLWSNMENKFQEALKSFDLIVVGYNGADDSIMNTLAKLKEIHYGLLWCGQNADSLNWRVTEFINNTPNSYFIEIKSFEFLVFELYNLFKTEINIPDFISNAEKKEKEIFDFISDFKSDLNEDLSLDISDKENINNTLEIVLDRNSFFKVAELSTDEQFQFIQKLRIDGISRTLKNIYSHISWENAQELYKELDENGFFQRKLKEASIQHASNALSNLKKIDFERTKAILDSIDNSVIQKKIEEASPEDLYSGINELKAISPLKIEKILTERNFLPTKIDFEKQDLRHITYTLKTVSRDQGIDLLISRSDDLLEKLNSEEIKEIVLFFDTISDLYYKECRTLFESLDSEKLRTKIEKQDLSLLSITIRVFNQINKELTKVIVSQLDNNQLVSRLNETNLLSLKSILFTLKDVDLKLAKKLFDLVSDEELYKKFNHAELLNIAESAEYLAKIDTYRIKRIIHRFNSQTLTAKINNENFSYQQFGNAMSKLIVFDFDNICKSARDANSDRLSDLISSTLNKTGEQVFLHFVPTYFKVDRELFSKIIQKASQEYIDNILKWSKIDLYTVNLPYLKRIFDNNNMKKESEFVSYIISNNQERFNKKIRKKWKKY
ncbi:MAG: SIR2 family protein [Mariniphaga sp.]|jgi:NAD-dependent SIR2 family protein deacetylase|nr:SIR2 family protein [Mariniphaga sp.]